MSEPTIGQAFAARWLSRNFSNYSDRGNPEDLFQQIASGVDDYAHKKALELRTKLLAVAVDAAEGKTSNGEVTFDSEGMLQNNILVRMAMEWRKNMDRVTRFPVS